jgi:hypothetical protein
MTFMSVMQGTTFALYLVRNFLVIALACFRGLVSLAQYKGGPLLLISTRAQVVSVVATQLQSFAQKARELRTVGIALVVLGTNSPEEVR